MAIARSRPSANADVIRIPTSLSIPSETTWKQPLPSPNSNAAPATSFQASLVEDVKEALSAFQSRSTRKAETTQNTPRSQAPIVPSQQYDSLHSKFDLVPGSRTKKKIYPLAPVFSECWDTSQYMERFEYVQTELRRAIDRHRELRDHARSIDFLLRMVGTSPQSAEPSIVIVCRATECKKLRALFKEKAGEKLYCGKRSRVFEMFKKDPPARPPFNLVYYRTGSETLRRQAASHIVTTDVPVDGVLPGTRVYYQGAQAKIGVTLNVDNMTLSTTVDHLFHPETASPLTSNEDTLSIRSFESDQRTLDDSDLISLEPLWVDDSEDDDSEDPEVPGAVASVSPCMDSNICKDSCATLKHAYGHKLDPTLAVPGSEPYLDYALLELSPGVIQTLQPNTCRLRETDTVAFPLRVVASEPTYHAVPVYLLSGARGVQSGCLLGNYAYLGSNPGQAPCKVWTLLLDSPNGLVDGDCGSMVVDQETHTVYGHVIGSNPMNQVYVVPLKHVIEQIKLTFGASKVSLYDPIYISPAVQTTDLLADTIKVNNDSQALVPYRRYSDLCLSSQPKALHSAVQFGSQKGNATEEDCHQKYTRPFETFACVCGRRYDDIPSPPLSVEEFFQKATRPTSKLEVLTFWLSMLDFIRPRKSLRSRREAWSKDSTTQKPLLCHRPAPSIDSRSEFMGFPTAVSLKSKSLPTMEWKERTSKHATTTNELARITSATSQENSMLPCQFCQPRQNLQGAYYLFSIGGLLLESLVWVLAGHDSLNDIQQYRRDPDVSLVDQGLQLFNRESGSLQAKAIANGDSTSLQVLQLTERILNQDLDFPELWRWQQKISEELERGLNMMRRKEPNFLGKRTSNKRALDSFIVQNFARNPVVDPNSPSFKSLPDLRALASRARHSVLRVLSRSPASPVP